MSMTKKCTQCLNLEEVDGKQECVRIHPLSGLVIHVNPTKEREASLKQVYKMLELYDDMYGRRDGQDT